MINVFALQCTSCNSVFIHHRMAPNPQEEIPQPPPLPLPQSLSLSLNPNHYRLCKISLMRQERVVPRVEACAGIELVAMDTVKDAVRNLLLLTLLVSCAVNVNISCIQVFPFPQLFMYQSRHHILSTSSFFLHLSPTHAQPQRRSGSWCRSSGNNSMT
jgi:hypothetical protein